MRIGLLPTELYALISIKILVALLDYYQINVKANFKIPKKNQLFIISKPCHVKLSATLIILHRKYIAIQQHQQCLGGPLLTHPPKYVWSNFFIFDNLRAEK